MAIFDEVPLGFPSLVWMIASCVALYISGLWAYRLTLHPLAKYPGPWVAKVSDIYGAYHNARGQLHIQTQLGHERWGSVFRQGPNKLVFNSVTALHDIYHTKDHVQKSVGYTTMVPSPGAYNIFTAVDKSIHRIKRKLLGQGFSDQALRMFEPTMLGHIDQFVANLTDSTEDVQPGGWSRPRNMTERSRWLQYDIMGEFGFGQSFELQNKEKNRFLIDAVEATGFRAGVYVQYPALQALQLDRLLNRRSLKMRERYLDLMSQLVKSRLAARQEAQPDLFSFVIDAKDPETGTGFTEDELWAESRFLLIAGADTSSTGLTAAFFYLSANQQCLEKLTAEIRTAFQSFDDIRTGLTMGACQYLRACIDETLRMSPPISGTLWREVLPSGIALDNHYIPAGTDLGVNPYAVHHNEALFPNSYTFRPERWIVSEDNSQEAVDRIRHAFSPFSLGPRSCAGRNMAYMELSNTLAKTVWATDLRRVEGHMNWLGGGTTGGLDGRQRETEFQLYEHITCNHNGPLLQFRVRDPV